MEVVVSNVILSTDVELLMTENAMKSNHVSVMFEGTSSYFHELEVFCSWLFCAYYFTYLKFHFQCVVIFYYREAEIRNTILAQVLDQAARARCKYPKNLLIKNCLLVYSSAAQIKHMLI